MTRRQYRFSFPGTLTIDDAEIVQAVVDTSPEVIIQDPPETITPETRLRVDLNITELIEASLPMQLPILINRIFFESLDQFQALFRALFPTAAISFDGVEIDDGVTGSG